MQQISSQKRIIDPRKVRHVLKIGEKLAEERAELLTEIIQKSPNEALERALPRELIEGTSIPPQIKKHLEKWEGGLADFDVFYGCKGGDHLNCEFSRYTNFSDGRKLKTFAFGRRKNLHSQKGLAVWGVSINDQFAVSDKSYFEEESGVLEFAGSPLTFSSTAEKDLFKTQSFQAERKAQAFRSSVQYPVIAGSNGVTIFLEQRYQVVTTPMTWAQAEANATAENGRLVCIGSVAEDAYVKEILSKANIVGTTQAWIGLTDNPDQNGTFLDKENNVTLQQAIFAEKGNWKWLSGDDVGDGYTNWINNLEPNSTSQSYGALDWTTGKWSSITAAEQRPFVIEFDNGFEPATNVVPIDGFRKVIVVPVRYRDEGFIYNGSSAPLVDNLGNPLYPGTQQDGFVPVSQEELAATMEDVKQFYLRNSDNTFHLEPVITPTVTIDFNKYSQVQQINDEDTRQFDSSGNLIGSIENIYSPGDILGQHGPNALYKLAQASREWDFFGPAFQGVSNLTINTPSLVLSGNFTAPPEITFQGGNIDPATNMPDPDFVPAKAEAILNSKGEISRIKVLDSGSFYHTAPTVLFDGNATFSNNGNVTATVQNIGVTWVIVSSLSSTAAGGALGWGNLPGMGSWAKTPTPNPWYPDIDPGNSLSFGVTIAHELGHNFSLQHANLYQSFSEKPNSDEGQLIGYANPYSIMGNRAILASGDLTVPSKVNMNSIQGFGLTIGNTLGVDVGSFFDANTLQNTNLTETNQSGVHPNTFRIYRHDYGMGPFPLRVGEYSLVIPEGNSSVLSLLRSQNIQSTLRVGGPGDGAEAVIDLTGSSPKINIISGGRGYAEEPIIEIIDDLNKTVVQVDPTWIQLKSGTGENSFKQAHLRDFSSGAHRGLRGLEINASQFSAINEDDPTTLTVGDMVSSYWLSYRRSASEFGLTVNNGHRFASPNPLVPGSLSIVQGLLDMTLNTPGDFTDCFLMPGHTFSDYESDVHITPIRKGGIYPMEYLEVVVNIGTSGSTSIPDFNVISSPRYPSVGEDVKISVEFSDANASDFAYGWFTNENMDVDPENKTNNRYEWVNQRLSFKEATAYARMKGGHLACINSEAEQKIIFSLINKNLGLSTQPDYLGETLTTRTSFIWLGATDLESEGVWKWENGNPFIYKNWGSIGIGEPDNFGGDQHALTLAIEDFPQGRKGEWNDMRLNERLTFVIEYPDFQANQPVTSKVLNQSSINKSFDEPGQHVVRLVVSDMKGAISSRNLVVKVGDYGKVVNSSASGTVRSNNGFVQGARVAFSKAPLIEHSVKMSGNEKDWFLPDGQNDPLTYNIDGQEAPNLLMRRGEVHRFRFDQTASNFGLTFFDQPESEAPRVKINMLVTPVVDSQGNGYSEVPEVNSSQKSLFSSYMSKTTGTIRDYQDVNNSGQTFGQQTEEFLISRPFAKSLLSDTNVTAVRVAPIETDVFGNYVAFGGVGHERNSPPEVTVSRASFWEDYSDENATAKAYVDGIGTISPVNSLDFLGNTWRPPSNNYPIPEVVVLGTGKDFNASVISFTQNNQPRRRIEISNQGTGWEPDGSMAVLHYPLSPFANWTFDRHESLYDEPDEARYQPSPVWNPVDTNNLLHHWTFDEENGTTIFDQVTTGSIDLNLPFNLSSVNRSQWGTKGRATRFEDDTFTLTSGSMLPNPPYTLSLWMSPDADDNFTFNSLFNVTDFTSSQASPNNRQFTYAGITTERSTNKNLWSHISIVAKTDGSGFLYVDGNQTGITNLTTGNFFPTAFSGLLDEILIYSEALTEAQVKQLAGRSYLDLSGNNYHAVPMGNAFPMSSSASDPGSSTNVPTPAQASNNRVGSLGNSFNNERHGRSIQMNGNDYLDLSNHTTAFRGLSEGSLSFWINTGTNSNIILSGSKTDDNDTYLKFYLNDEGKFETVFMSDGSEITKFYANPVLTDSTWKHVVMTMDENGSAIFVNGQRNNASGYAGGSGVNRAFFADVQGMDFLAIGKHLDSNVTEHFTGRLDDFNVYDRVLTNAEVTFLYNLRLGKEQLPRLEAVVNAVGTVEILQNGLGFKEQPEAFFSYGLEGNLTSELDFVATFDELNTTEDPARLGKLTYVSGEDQVYSYHYVGEHNLTSLWRTGGIKSGWYKYELAVGVAELNATTIDQVLWTKEVETLTSVILPDNREIFRKYLEYVEHNGTYTPANGLFGYSVPPDLHLEGSPTDQNATAYALFFIDENSSAEITNPGLGMTANGFTSNEIRISGKGFRPPQNDRVYFTDQFGDPTSVDVQLNAEEEWGQRKAVLAPVGVFTHRLTTVLKVGPGGFTFTHTRHPNPLIVDTIVGDGTSIFTQQLRVGDVVEFLGVGQAITGIPDYVVKAVIDDQNVVVDSLTADFTSGNIFVNNTAYTATNDIVAGGVSFFDRFPPPAVIKVYSPQGIDKSPFSSEYLFRDWISIRNGVGGTGEPRNEDTFTDFNLTLSHVNVLNSGYGYLMPVDVVPVGGTPSQQSLQAWVETNNTYPLFRHATLQIESNATDVNGTILEGNASIRILDPGYGYEQGQSPAIAITGGGGSGAQATSVMGQRFILPIGKSLVSVGMINPNQVLTRSFVMEQNTSIPLGNAVVDPNMTDRISVQYSNATIQNLIDALNAPAVSGVLFDPNSSIDGNASLFSGSNTTPLIELNATSHDSISLINIAPGMGGRGYRNLNSANIPSVNLDVNTTGDERNASLSMRLGGALGQISPCATCEILKDNFLTDGHEHTGPWVEIWDKGRDERDINDSRALAVPKIVNGRIEKIIVVESGNGYIEPIAKVRGIAPRHGHYADGTTREDHYESRIWMCTNLRETKGGEFVKCGHIERGMYPPENCPGEVDTQFPVGAIASDQNVTNWQNRHTNLADAGTPKHYCNDGLVDVDLMNNFLPTILNYSADTHTHFNVNFKVRVCTGKKGGFVLLNDPYRHSYENWEKWDANISVITQQGKIKEVIVHNGGEMYLGGELTVTGSGAGVDAIPVIREDGFNTMIIFDDPNLKNIELDQISNPLGAGMGFNERPWSWDSNYPAVFGPTERPVVISGNFDESGGFFYSLLSPFGDASFNQFTPGDRLHEIVIDDFGLFDSNQKIDNITIEYDGSNSTHFQAAEISAELTHRLTKISLDQNATYQDQNPQNNSSLWRWRSLYEEQPSFNILDPSGNLIPMVEQNSSDFIRANGNGNYLFSEEGAYFDLYVDDKLPENFYYGFGRGFAYLPAMGSSVQITESIPGLTWGSNEPSERNMSVYTDQNGFFSMPSLEPGMYNVAVFMEDENFQESTFRPSSNPDRISQVLYVPGFSMLTLESDNYGYGKSKVIWSKESRRMSRPIGAKSSEFEEIFERKTLEGIGAGFQTGDKPELTIIPNAENTSLAIPNISATVLVDGSLRLQIIDDENTTIFNPNDRFTVHYSSTINGLDFVEDYDYSLSAQASWAGSASSFNVGTARLDIFPNDGNGLNAVEIPLSTSYQGDSNYTFFAKAFDENGTALDASGVQWKLVYDFNSSDGNNSNLGSLTSPKYYILGDDGTRGFGYYFPVYLSEEGLGTNHPHPINAGTVYMEDAESNHAIPTLPENTGLIKAPTDFNQSNGINLRLYSTLRRGRVDEMKIVASGVNYTSGSVVKMVGIGNGFEGVLDVSSDGSGQIIDVNITSHGSGYDSNTQVLIVDENGTGAVIEPIFGGGELFLEANMTHNGTLLTSRVKIFASERNQLESREKWLDLYFDQFSDRNNSWWNDLIYDFDLDGLTNHQEWLSNANPLNLDTDTDGMSDYVELANGTNLRMKDTDGDGLSDFAEDGNGTNPLLFDTDRDGMSDGYELSSGFNPLLKDTDSLGHISGIFLNTTPLEGNVSAYLELNDTLATFYKKVNLGKASTYPQYFYQNLIPQNKLYKIFAYIDRNGDGGYTTGEPFGEWEGNVTADTSLVQIQVLDPPPNIQFASGVDQNVSINPSPENLFPSGVEAFDLYEGALTQANITVEGNGTTIVDRNQTSGVSSIKPNVSPGYYELNFLATDGLGTKSEILTQKIVVRDVTNPALLLFQDSSPTLEAGTIYSEPGFYAYDNVDGDITNKVSYPENFISTIPGINYISYTVTDSTGNSNSTQRSITVVDTTKPTLVLNGDTSITMEAGDIFNDPNATWVDNADGTGMVSSSISVDEQEVGLQKLNYIYIDKSTNVSNSVTRSLTIVDTTPASIFLNGNAITIHEAGQPFVDPGATWIDNADGNGTVLGLGDLNSSKLGEYDLVYSYKDESNNSSVSITRKVQIVDTTAPQLQLVGNQNITTEVGFSYTDQGAIWTDAVDGNGTVFSIGSVNVQTLNTYLLRYSYTDQAGNAGQPFDLNRTVTVKDTLSPTIVFPQKEYSPFLLGQDINFSDVIAVDLFDGNLTSDLQISYPPDFDENKSGSYLINFSVADSSGNLRSVDKRIHILNAATHSLISTNDVAEEGWFTSNWLGSFYPTGGSWIYHLKLGWLNVMSGGTDGYWMWDFHFQSWWWTAPSVFPYYYLEGENGRWHYLELDLPVIQYYDFNSQQWKSRP
ncbi:MAG: immunoglobulin-like domain-containing protein [Opitutales bacterium]